VKHINQILKIIKKYIKLNNNKNEIKQSGIDCFFDTISEFFFIYMSLGLLAFNPKDINLENKYTKMYFISGFNCIKNGVDPITLEIILSYLTLATIKNKSVSQQELLEIKLLEKIFKIIDQFNIKEYISIAINFCSSDQFNKIEKLFKEIKPLANSQSE
jgi:hypothetical protein